MTDETYQADHGQLVRQAVESQIGMLTCQVLELSVQLRAAHAEIAQLRATQVPATSFDQTSTPPTTTSPASTD